MIRDVTTPQAPSSPRLDSLELPKGPMTRARSKRFHEVVSALLFKFWKENQLVEDATSGFVHSLGRTWHTFFNSRLLVRIKDTFQGCSCSSMVSQALKTFHECFQLS